MSVEIDGYVVDVFVTEEHSHEAEVTQWPVEEGADITDHVRLLPDSVTLEGIVSDTPIGAVADQRGADVLPSEEAYTILLAIRENRKTVSVKTSLTTYHNMILKSLTEPRSATTGEALRFRATFVQITTVKNERTVVKVSLPRGNKKVNRGNKVAKPVDTPDPDDKVPGFDLKKKSVLRAIINAIDG